MIKLLQEKQRQAAADYSKAHSTAKTLLLDLDHIQAVAEAPGFNASTDAGRQTLAEYRNLLDQVAELLAVLPALEDRTKGRNPLTRWFIGLMINGRIPAFNAIRW